MALTIEQTQALDSAMQGHNLSILGQAGTGKSFLIRRIEEALKTRGKSVYVTCTTGIACANFEGAMTIHRWCGIQDGRLTLKELMGNVIGDDRYRVTRDRIEDADVLIIDEISMLSYRMFTQIEAVCRAVRQNCNTFGGIQVLVCGDFFQLPPVPNSLYGDAGEFAFSGPLWNDAFPHNVILHSVLRQQDRTLINAVNETATGHLSKSTASFLRGLNRPVKGEPVKIFATNQQVDMANRLAILKHAGDLKVLLSEDTGDEKYLQKIRAPHTLWLKEGCTVMLLRNISEKLVNGLIGTVKTISVDCVHVYFPSVDLYSMLTRSTFSVYDPTSKRNVAQRLQYPLTLCYGLTVHKSQGMTLDSVEIDCLGMFKPGQLGVALGRAKTVDGVRVINFKDEIVFQHQSIVYEFYDGNHMPCDDNLECCQHLSTAELDISSVLEEIDFDNVLDSDEDEDILHILESEMAEETVESESDNESDVQEVDEFVEMWLKSTLNTYEITPTQVKMNETIRNMPLVNAKLFCAKMNSNIKKMSSLTMEKEVKNKNVTEFYEKCHQYITSNKYKTACTKLFNKTPDDTEYVICYELYNLVRQHVLKVKSTTTLKTTEISANVRYTVDEMSSGARAKVRYVSGYVFSKLHYRHNSQLKRSMFKLGTSAQEIVINENKKVTLLKNIIRSQGQIMNSTTDRDSLEEIRKKQNVREGLLNITDEAFNFSKCLCVNCLNLQTEHNLNEHGKHLHYYVSTLLQQDGNILEQWVKLFSTSMPNTDILTDDAVHDCLSALTDNSHLLMELFEEFVEKFCRVMSKQFRKDILELWNVEKLKAHRKHILEKREKTNIVTMKSIIDDKSADKMCSKHLLIAMVCRNDNSLEKYTIKNLTEIATIFNEKVAKNIKKSELIQQLKTAIIPKKDTSANSTEDIFHEPTAQQITEPVPSTSTGMTSADTSISSDNCKKCGKKYKKNEHWIQCDICDFWFHRKCAGLSAKKEWEKYKVADWCCSECV